MLQFRIAAQRGDRGYQLERGAGRINAVAGAVEWIVRRRADQREDIASRGIEHYHRSFLGARFLQVTVEDLSRAQLQPDVYGKVNVAVAGENACDSRIAGLMAIAHLRRQLGEIVTLQLAVGIV